MKLKKEKDKIKRNKKEREIKKKQRGWIGKKKKGLQCLYEWWICINFPRVF
jgi:hypothetical protein